MSRKKSKLASINTSLNYNEAIRLIMTLPNFERSACMPDRSTFHLERMCLLMQNLGNPHRCIPTIHIAGSDGKGSIAAMVTSILTAQGYKSGLYTSPHLHSIVERIRVGMSPINPFDFTKLVKDIWPSVQQVCTSAEFGKITFFELLTAMAFSHFNKINVDCQVIEVGLGGKKDATNVVVPTICAISPISLDHISILGETISLIALEKAGIIKNGIPTVVAPQSCEAMSVLKNVSKTKLAPLIRVDKNYSWNNINHNLKKQSFKLSGPKGQYNLETSLLGSHQIENAATATAIVETLNSQGLPVSKNSVESGIRNVAWPARFQILLNGPVKLVVDGAHNPRSMNQLARMLEEYFVFQHLILIFGSSSGHNSDEIIAAISHLSPTVIAAQSRHPKSTPTKYIAKSAIEQGLKVEFESKNLGIATKHALDIARPNDLVVGTGSLFVAAEIIEHVCKMSPELYPEIKQPV